MNIKRKICNEFVKSPYATPYCVIDHSRTDNGTRELKNLIETNNGIAPCLTTRGDILGIVIEDMKERKKERKFCLYGNGESHVYRRWKY